MAKRRRRINQKHPLAIWLKDNDMTQQKFAEKSYMGPQTVHKIMDLNGSQLSFVTLWKINWATQGIVSPSVLRRFEARTMGRNTEMVQFWAPQLWKELD
jgi:hypothetical protein